MVFHCLVGYCDLWQGGRCLFLLDIFSDCLGCVGYWFARGQLVVRKTMGQSCLAETFTMNLGSSVVSHRMVSFRAARFEIRDSKR